MEVIVKHFSELTTAELYAILQVRVSVFIVEQQCPYPEIDDKDQDAYHVFTCSNGKISAYLRVLKPGVSFPEASLGRVLTKERKSGLGKVIMERGIQVAREQFMAREIRIEAQSYAKGFYERFGFRQVSDEFLEDGIPHIEMLRIESEIVK